jgi:fucose permease
MTSSNYLNTARITLTSFLAYFVLSAIISPLGIVSQPMATYYGVSVTQATAVFSFLTTGILIGAFVAVFIFDYIKVKWVVVYSTVVIAAALMAAYSLDRFELLPYCLFFVGLGCGINLSSAAVVITRTYNEKLRPSMLLLTDSSYSGAATLSSFLAVTLMAANNSWFSVYALAIGAIGVLVLTALVSSYPIREVVIDDQESNSRWPLSVYICGVALLFYLLGLVVIYSWVPNYAQAQFGFDASAAGGLVGGFFSGMFFGQLAMFVLVLILPVRFLIIVCCLGATVFSAFLWHDLGISPTVAMFGLGLISGGILKVGIAYGTTLTLYSSPKMVSYLLLNTALGTAIAPALSAWIVDSFGLTAVIIFATICYALTGLLLMLSFILNQLSSVKVNAQTSVN